MLLALTFDREPLAALDSDVAEWVSANLPGAIELLARPSSWLGGWIGMTLLAAGVAVVLLRERRWLDLGFLVSAFLGSAVAVALLKAWVDRARPDLATAVSLPESASFPSGHATSGVAGLGAVAILVSERFPSQRARVWLWSLTLVLGLTVGLSRLALNVHYVTDVLAGWCFGLAWLAACLLVRDGLVRRGVPLPRS